MSTLLRAHLPCPHCGSSDALAQYENGTTCFSCGHVTRQEKTQNRSNNNILVSSLSEEVQLPEDFTANLENFSEAQAWLRKVQITPDLCKKYRIGFSIKWQRVIIPSLYNGSLLGWQGRAIFEAQNPKYIQANP